MSEKRDSTPKVTRQEQQKWEGLTDFFQYTSIGLLLISVFLFDQIPKATAKSIIWYWAGGMFIFATIGFVVGNISAKKTKAYFDGELDRINRIRI